MSTTRIRVPLSPAARRLIAARFVSRVGGEAGFFVGVWGTAAFALGATPSSLALLMAALAVASMIGSAVAGVAVDRVDPKRVLIVGEVLFVPLILTLTTVDSMPELTLRAPLAWLAGSLVLTAVTSMPPHLSQDERQVERTNTVMEAAGTIAFVLGPALGALIVRWSGLPMVFVVDAATSVVAVALIAPLRLRPVAHRERRSGVAELREGFAYAWQSRPIRLLLVLGSLTWLSFGTFAALEPLFYRDVLGTGPEALGYVNSVFGAGLFLGAFLLDRAAGRLTNVRTVTWLTAACGIGAVVYVGTDRLAVVVVGAVVWGTLLGALMPLLRTLMHLHATEGYVGRVMGTFNVAHGAGEIVPLAVAPALAGALGVQPVLIGVGIVLVVLAPLALPAATRLDRARAVAPPTGRDLTDRIEDLEEHVPTGL
jgi:MFS transporter, DHA3 family, macrolide efflux protein